MAQVQEKSDTGKGSKRRANRMSTHLDMTPMVDLAFLLLTFFMLTTTFSKPHTMELIMPFEPQDDKPMAIKPENALTVILAEDNKLFYYFGFAGDEPEIAKTDFSASGIRKVLLSDKVKSNEKMVVLIKAMKASRYSNLVDILDEMKITEVRKFALVDINAEDEKLVKNKSGS